MWFLIVVSLLYGDSYGASGTKHLLSFYKKESCEQVAKDLVAGAGNAHGTHDNPLVKAFCVLGPK